MDQNREESKFEHVVESSWAKSITRFVVPALLMIIVFFAKQSNDDIRMALKAQQDSYQQLNTKVDAVAAKVDIINVRIDDQLLDQINRMQKQMESIDMRTRILEANERIPNQTVRSLP